MDADRLGTVGPGIAACLVVDVVCESSSGAPTQIGGPLRVAQAACESKGRSRGRVMWRKYEIGWMWAALEGSGFRDCVWAGRKRNGMAVNGGAVR